MGIINYIKTVWRNQEDGAPVTKLNKDHLNNIENAIESIDNIAVAITDPRLTNARVPTGAAGGALSGSYPNPVFAVDMATQAELDAAQSSLSATNAALATSLNTHTATTTTAHGGIVANTDPRLADSRSPAGNAGGDLSGTYPSPIIANLSVTAAKMATGTITNAQIAAGAAIAKSKLAALGVVNSDVAAGAAIAYAKLALTGSIVDADVAVGAGILPAKIAGTAVVTTDTRLSDQRTPLDGSVVLAKIAASLIDPIAANAGLRTLGTGAQQAAAGNDARLSDQRTPLDASVTTPKLADGSVATTKLADGAVTAVKVANTTLTDAKFAAANVDGLATAPSLRTLGTGAQQATAGNDARLSDQRTPLDASVTSAKFAAGAIDPVAGTAGARTLGTGAQQAAAGNDTRLSDTRTPTDASITPPKFAASAVDPVAGTAGARTLGTGAQQATAGNDARLSDQRTPLDASVTLTKLATAVSSLLPATGEKAALAGTTGTPGSTNKFVTDSDRRVAISSGHIVNIPAANLAQFYFADDQNGGTLYQSNGTTWTAVTNGLTGGSDVIPTAANQLPIWSGTTWGTGLIADANIGTSASIAATKIAGTAVVTADARLSNSRRWKAQELLNNGTTIRECFPRWRISSGSASPTAGRVEATAVPVYSGDVLTRCSFLAPTGTPSGITHWWLLLYDSGFNLIAQTADQTTTSPSNTPVELAYASPYTVAADGLVYSAILIVGTTPFNVAAAAVGTGLTNSSVTTVSPQNKLAGATATGLTTPPSTISLTSNLTNINYFVLS